MVCIGYDICNITYERIDWDGYDDEYILSMNHAGIWLEKFKRENGYYEDESTIVYIMDNCSSKVIPYCKGKTVYEVTVGAVEDEECSCGECECTCKKDEKPTTTTTTATTKSTYKVNGKECSKETYDEALRTIEDMYTKNIRDALYDYSDLIDEMHKWKRLLNW